ncbi:MAG TPA: radical SAM protein [Candidatus Eremiobacteraeota bacterium]|nr:MAG: Ribosomal protein S12 methylthiotransferase RimO [bacterium ADurb.Bin363]HPZ08428.1 radical SAM protein [Candidatus Eremiobacteraeota bacterium]
MKFGIYHVIEDLPLLPVYDYEAPPLGLLYIASYLEKYLGFKDIILERENISNLIEKKPDIIGISSLSVYFHKAIEAAQKIKDNLNIPVLIGGPHITILPEILPDVFDIGIIGEGEETVLELIKVFLEDGEFRLENLKNIQGIVYHGHTGTVINPPRELIADMDIIPFPGRDLCQPLAPTPTLLTSRGCPYKCTFCSPSRYWKKFRYFSSSYVIKELSQLVANIEGIPVITVADDTFVIDSERFKNIYKFILEEGINKKVEFHVNIKASVFKEELCKKLKDINVTKVYYGAESASQRILDYYQKDQTVEDNQRILDLCAKYCIDVTASFIVGAPVEKREDLEATYRFIDKNADKLLNCAVIPLLPLPGTIFWDYAIEKGLITPRGEHIKSHGDFVYMCENISKSEFQVYLNRFNDLIKYRVKRNITLGERLLLELRELERGSGLET